MRARIERWALPLILLLGLGGGTVPARAEPAATPGAEIGTPVDTAPLPSAETAPGAPVKAAPGAPVDSTPLPPADSANVALPALQGPTPGGIYEATLDNGLKVIMKEVHTAPLMCVSTWFRAGSKNETVGATGIAHLLEHMMFKGTAKHGKGEFDRILESNGAVNNASTWLDRTNYYILIAAEKTDLAMDLQADQMRGALFTEQDLDDEMPVVRNEMEQGEDDAWSELDDRLVTVAILEHPYHWPTIGWKSDVEAATAAEIRGFYDKYYWPNDAYLVLVGDLPAETMLEKAVRHFGTVSRGGIQPKVVTVEPPQKGERRFLIREAGRNRILGMAYRSTRRIDPDSYALDLLGQVLGRGKSSRLYKALVDGGLATDIYVYNQAEMADPFLFFIYAFLSEEASPDSAEAVIDREIEKIKREPPTAVELQRSLKQTRVETLFSRDQLTSLMFAIGEAESAGGYEIYEHYLESLAVVTPEAVQGAAQHYLVADARTVGLYLPEGEEGGSWLGHPGDRARSPSWRRSPDRPGVVSTAGAEPPEDPDAAPATGSPARLELPNGIVLLVQESHENPTVALRGRIEGGLLLEPKGKEGVAALTAQTLPLGTESHAPDELAELLESHGIEISFDATDDAIEIDARSLSEDFPLLIELLGEMSLTPRFDESQLEVGREQLLTSLRDQLQDTYSLAYHRALEGLYAPGSPYARWVEGSEESLKALKREDVVAYHQQLLQASRWTLAVVGDVRTEELRGWLEKSLGKVPRGGKLEVAIPEMAQIEPGGDVVRIPVPDKSQVDLVFVGPGVPPDDPQYDAAYLANVVLGGSYTSRLNRTLRDDEGLTYSVRSRFVYHRGSSHWVAHLGVNPENIAKAIQGMRRELGRLHDPGIQQEELDRAREYAIGSFPIRLQSKSAIAGTLLEAEVEGLGLNYISDFPERMRRVDLQAARAAASRFADPDRVISVLAGTY